MSDIFDVTRAAFDLPPGLIYLDGNSLGAMPRAARVRVAHEMDHAWSQRLIRSWNEAGWWQMPGAIGNQIAPLVGAAPSSVAVGDSTSVNVFKVLTAALAMAGKRRVILSDTGNFPTDLYVAQGVARMLGLGHRLKLVAPDAVHEAIDDSIAVLMLTQVDYRTGRLHDMAALTRQAKAAGAVAIWDLAHSAGALPVHLAECGVDFAIGCGYKYLNGGPGAPAFAYVRPDLADSVEPALSGWWGHDAPFDFDLGYRPAAGIGRMSIGTAPILSMAALHAAMRLWDGMDMQAVRAQSIVLSQRFIAEVEARCPDLRLASPRDPEQRGSQVSFHFAHGDAAMQALISLDVIGDFRAPDIMRFGFTPLYVGEADVVVAAERLERVMGERLWERAEFAGRRAVT